MRRKILNAFILSLLFTLIAIQVEALDYPHNDINNIGCDACHFVYGDEPDLLPEWTDHVPQDIDDTQYNDLCWSCHNDIRAPYMMTHSSLQTGNGHGDWTVECRTCHNLHTQKQLSKSSYRPDVYLTSGASTGLTTTTLTKAGAGWTVDVYEGLVLIPYVTSATKRKYGYKITGNTSDTITVEGPINLTKVSVGNTFAVIYGKLIKDSITLDNIIGADLPKSGSKTVKFFNSSGQDNAPISNSFADGDSVYDGICEVCHTGTTHFRNDGTGSDPLHTNMNSPAGTNCIVCHTHSNGFRAMGGGAHPTHVTNTVGPQLSCTLCHGSFTPPLLADGENLANTTVCNNCHSSAGAVTAKTYWNNDPGTWVGTDDQAGYCGGCHDSTPANTEQDGTGDTTVDILGNNTTYGFFVTGHGKTTGNYASLSWQATSASGNPAANKACDACHDLTTAHYNSGTKRLKAGYEDDIDNSNCKQCHDPGTVAVGDPQWYTTYTAFENSAHKAKKCSDCHDVHGVSGAYNGMTNANKESLCYQCHKDTSLGGIENDALSNNRTGFYNSADDIQEAFSKSTKHNLGASFSVSSSNYTLECVSCHNVHIVTGKYWDAAAGKSPITRFTSNTEIWGDESGEKMDDYAALGSGTGGFYYKTAQGYSLGATGLPFDTTAEYRPPKDGSGYDAEFDGDILPDYTSFCLDCHQYNMGGDTQGAINWAGDPYKHGLSIANGPGYISDSGTAGFWGTSGNPDVLFDMNYVTRGRHTGHFMRWPYDAVDRAAGINFVLSCTDCHEAHGSNRGGMIRERYMVNSNGGCGTGASGGDGCNDGGNWNNFCNACHYYYGGGHVGMSCGSAASCHPHQGQNSIHRGSGTGTGGTQLMLTSAGYESDYIRPDFTPDITSATGHIGSDQLTVTFRNSVYADMDLSGTLASGDFWLFDKNGDNSRTITNVVHTAGSTTAVITMSLGLVEADLATDTVAMRPASAWSWYAGGYVNAATGTLGAEAVSAGPWPVTITGPPPINILDFLYERQELRLNGVVNDSDQMYVTFAEGVYSNNGGGGDLQAGDFVLVCGGRTISSVTHTAGDSYAVLTLNSTVDQSEIGACTVAAAANAIYDLYGSPAGTGAYTLALPPEASVNDLIVRWNFNEGSGTTVGSSGASGTQEDMHGVLTRNVQWVTTSTKPGAGAGDYAVNMDRVSDRGAVQLNYTVNPNDGFPPATYNSGGASVIVQEMQQTSEFSFSVWIKPTALGCQEGKDLGLNNKLRRDVLTTQFWIKNWALGIMRFSNDGDPLNGNCTDEDSTHDVLRFWVAVGDPTDMRCDAWGGSWPEYVHPVSPAGYTQGSTLMPTDQAVCDTSAYPTLPTNTQAHSFAQTEISASGAPTYSGVALQPGVWQHVVGTWDGRYIRIYIDGQLAAETDMGGTGDYIMVADPSLWGGDLNGDGSLYRHVSSFFSVGTRPSFSGSGSPSGGAVYWNANGFYDLGNLTYVGELDDVKYWDIALPLATIQY